MKPFVYNVGQIIKDDRRNLKITETKRLSRYNNKSKKYIKYVCNECLFESDYVQESDLINKSLGCSACRGLSIQIGFNDIPTTAPWMVKYFQGGYDEAIRYTKASHKKIYPICPDCNTVSSKQISIKRIYYEKSIGCVCGDGFSYPEKFMNCVLDQLNICFETQYSPYWSNGKRYDFYLPDYGVIIETDGGLGHGKKIHSRSKLSVEESYEIDRQKDKMAFDNGISVIRINSDKSNMEYLSTQIILALSSIFNLSKIDWTTCNKFAIKNIIKEVCEFYESHKPISPNDVGMHFNIRRRQTINDYLNKGTKLGWCAYDKQSSIKLGGILRGKLKSQGINIYKNDDLVSTYNSLTELEDKSYGDLGIKLLQSGISHAFRKGKNQYKGYSFEYIS